MARVPLVCGNWKLHKTIAESTALANDVKNAVAIVRDVEVAVAPVYTSLHAVGKKLEGSAVALCAQDCFWEDHGAFTGEVSVALLKDVGCTYVIVGHSERRQHFGELDASVARKARTILHHGLAPIVCVGETLQERDAGETFARVAAQLEGSLNGIHCRFDIDHYALLQSFRFMATHAEDFQPPVRHHLRHQRHHFRGADVQADDEFLGFLCHVSGQPFRFTDPGRSKSGTRRAKPFG